MRLETFLATGLDVRISVHMPQTRCDSPSCPKTSPPPTAGIVSRARASYLSFTAFSAFLSRITSRSNVSKTCRAHRGRCKTACTPCLQSLGAASRRISRMRRPLRGLAYVSLGNRPQNGTFFLPILDDIPVLRQCAARGCCRVSSYGFGALFAHPQFCCAATRPSSPRRWPIMYSCWWQSSSCVQLSKWSSAAARRSPSGEGLPRTPIVAEITILVVSLRP